MTDAATQAVLAIFTDERGLAYSAAQGWLVGGGTENERDAATYVKGAATELLEDGGKTARALMEAVGCDPATAKHFDVTSKVDWMVLGEYFWQWYENAEL